MIKTLRNNFRQGMVILLSGCAILAISPMAVIRALTGQWLLAALDTVIVLGISLIFRYSLLHPHSVIANLISAGFYSIAAIVMVYINPETMIYWMFPVVAANFFLLTLKHAFVINCGLLLAIAPVLPSFANPIEPADMYIALTLVCVFTGLFAWKTEDQRLQLEALAHLDPLTGAGNRRKLFSSLEEAPKNLLSSIVLIDLDYFKEVNDELGHERGDKVLQKVSSLITQKLRHNDELYRYGGEEFLILLNNTDIHNACRIAEMLRQTIAEQLPITASFGCAQKRAGEDWNSWIARADKALYLAKNEGRNCVRPTSAEHEIANAPQ